MNESSLKNPVRQAPLQGVVVVDLTRVLAGPYLTMMLAEMGARVIKVERPGLGDDARHFGPFVEGQSAYFAGINRGKESIALNLKDPEGREIFLKLVKKADVLVENYKPGTMEKLDFGWHRLGEENPRLIYAAVSGFGHTGPYRDRPAYDLVAQAMGGIMSLTGHAGDRPVRVGTSLGDIAAALFGLSGVLAALYDREVTGRGTKVDVAMLDCQVAMLENAIGRFFADGQIPGPIGMRHPSITPFSGLQAKHGEYLVLAVGNDSLFARLCELLGRKDLIADERYSTNVNRTQHHESLYRELERALEGKSASEWLELFNQNGIPCGPINNVKEVVEDPQVLSRNMIVKAEGEQGLVFRMSGNPVKFSDYPDHDVRDAIPKCDGDRAAILDFLENPP
ncbi:MAG: CaiB/BaiF CoA-transferase family protein [Gammaproteobacteria bacterium]|nr:CaiB/BaiF CoA-transferase family protein [Gammaproteobacteria bacterium]